METIRIVQEAAARAMPPDHVEWLDGWLLRYTTSKSWWAGSVLAHGEPSSGEMMRRIIAAEEFYAGHGTAARFQISPPVSSPGLDDALAARGYGRSGQMSLQSADTATIVGNAPDTPLRIVVDEKPTSAWFDVWQTTHDVDPAAERAMCERVRQPVGYVRVLADGEAIAVGRAVADDGWAGVFGMATLPAARGKGAARTVLAALAEWAGRNGADRMYLQVEGDNDAALRLYGRMGFRELCGYHYRIAP
ncbi:GNAT family N-acetyltransferase [Stackebrandtia nassauensis]|uniref:GCN5-related N-acetyltransferase n=1 Tax=Stackebrandtia nassauensis (strain DSM 44728 / CIP 108903 / NRRL B-16338 / NBRC 102104 / LLR-40K-21) TaxID=446470 RepID=D3Q664_STANL|nr:GNAT family N-acetyltransferase [Stackebrandtia nassauensis]ADD42239.1 GCN5-related N-acetyltransferase [Stackebrandtia nassauensis DSM 44728]